MKIRLLSESDIDAILSLWNRHLTYDQLTPELLEEKVWDDSDFVDELAMVVEHREQVIAFAMGVIRPVQNTPVGYVKMLVVDSRFQRYGIGQRLLTELENRLIARDARTLRIAESAPNYITPGLDPRYTKAMILLEKNGYTRFKETWSLESDLSNQDFTTADAEQKLAEKGIEIRRGKPDDENLLLELLQKTGWIAWQSELKKVLNRHPATVHIALKDNKIIAFSAHNTNNYNTGSFGPLATLDECRGLKIGRILLHRGLQDIKEADHRFAIIPWAGPVSFYLHHCGAEIARIFYRYEKKVKSQPPANSTK
ncbi:MAG: GNAT family N-acetyltransferase [Calditrichaeota bacterium]|nr:MAG: GNAT family N-acetyltransferase [Calditrichota bacterium]